MYHSLCIERSDCARSPWVIGPTGITPIGSAGFPVVSVGVTTPQHRADLFLDPATDAAKIRAIFVHPDWARRGLGTLLLETCENAAKSAGFTKFEMGSTLTGVPLYKLRGYQVIEPIAVPLPNGESLPVIRMAKSAT